MAELNGWIHKFFSMHIFLSVFHLPLSSSLNSVLNTLFLFYYPYDVFFFPFYSSSLDPLSSSILKSLLLSKYSLLVLHLFPPPTMQCFLKNEETCEAGSHPLQPWLSKYFFPLCQICGTVCSLKLQSSADAKMLIC